jgi:hypothetical protein
VDIWGFVGIRSYLGRVLYRYGRCSHLGGSRSDIVIPACLRLHTSFSDVKKMTLHPKKDEEAWKWVKDMSISKGGSRKAPTWK